MTVDPEVNCELDAAESSKGSTYALAEGMKAGITDPSA